MVRFHNTRRKKIGTCVYLMAAEWFNNWRLHTDYEVNSILVRRERERL